MYRRVPSTPNTSAATHRLSRSPLPLPLFSPCLFHPSTPNPLHIHSPSSSPSPAHIHLHLSINREGRWGTTADFTTSFLHFSLFFDALWDLANSRLVHSLMLSSHLFFCLPRLLSSFTVPCKVLLARPVHSFMLSSHFFCLPCVFFPLSLCLAR